MNRLLERLLKINPFFEYLLLLVIVVAVISYRSSANRLDSVIKILYGGEKY